MVNRCIHGPLPLMHWFHPDNHNHVVLYLYQQPLWYHRSSQQSVICKMHCKLQSRVNKQTRTIQSISFICAQVFTTTSTRQRTTWVLRSLHEGIATFPHLRSHTELFKLLARHIGRHRQRISREPSTFVQCRTDIAAVRYDTAHGQQQFDSTRGHSRHIRSTN